MASQLPAAISSSSSSPSLARIRAYHYRRRFNYPVQARASGSSGAGTCCIFLVLLSGSFSCSSFAVVAGGSESEMVDSNMLVLRRRIHQLRLRERWTANGENHQDQWMEWEKSCFSSYRPDLSMMLDSLQTQLLDMRPSYLISLVSMLMAFLPAASILFLATLASQIASLCGPAL